MRDRDAFGLRLIASEPAAHHEDLLQAEVDQL